MSDDKYRTPPSSPPPSLPFLTPPRTAEELKQKYSESPPPEPKVSREYLDYVAEQQKKAANRGEPVADYGQYGAVDTRTAIKPSKGHELGPAQGTEGYDKLHPEEKALPAVEGHRAVYGEHKGKPVFGPADWKHFYPNWENVGDQIDVPLAKNKPLPQPELDYVKRRGIVFHRKIGSGGYATVWLVTDQRAAGGPRQFACKVSNLLKYKGAGKRGVHLAVNKMLEEVNLLAQLVHRNVVRFEFIIKVHDQKTGFPLNRLLVFMEVCKGSLSAYTRAKPEMCLPEDEGRQVMRDVCEGLNFLHRKNVVHFDIKPGNVLYTEDAGRRCYKLSDFGLAKLFPPGKKTTADRMIGTRYYMAPEVAAMTKVVKDSTVDAKRADIYSLGVTMLVVLTGPAAHHTLYYRWAMFPEFLNHPWWLYKNKLSEDAIDLCRQMCAIEPEKRPTIQKVLRHQWFA